MCIYITTYLYIYVYTYLHNGSRITLVASPLLLSVLRFCFSPKAPAWVPVLVPPFKNWSKWSERTGMTSHYYCHCRVYLSIDPTICMSTYLLCFHITIYLHHHHFPRCLNCEKTLSSPHLLDLLSLSSLVLFSKCACTYVLTRSLKVLPTPTLSLPC